MNFESDSVGGVDKMVKALGEFFAGIDGLDLSAFK